LVQNKKTTLIKRLVHFLVHFLVQRVTEFFFPKNFLVQTPLSLKFLFLFVTKQQIVIIMEDRIEDEEFELNEPTDDAEVADPVSGTAIELEKLLSEGKTVAYSLLYNEISSCSYIFMENRILRILKFVPKN
jgi:hypothetical protein